MASSARNRSISTVLPRRDGLTVTRSPSRSHFHDERPRERAHVIHSITIGQSSPCYASLTSPFPPKFPCPYLQNPHIGAVPYPLLPPRCRSPHSLGSRTFVPVLVVGDRFGPLHLPMAHGQVHHERPICVLTETKVSLSNFIPVRKQTFPDGARVPLRWAVSHTQTHTHTHTHTHTQRERERERERGSKTTQRENTNPKNLNASPPPSSPGGKENSPSAPCQCVVPGGHQTTSPALNLFGRPPLSHTQPDPAVTRSSCPASWVCQLVRAHGVNMTVTMEMASSRWARSM